MTSSFYRETWSKFSKESADPAQLELLSRQIAHSFWDYYLKDCHYETDYIDLLCEMATFADDPRLTNPGAQALFSIIIESLCDDFEELQTETYNRVMAQVITYCRNIPAGRNLDQSLKEFGLYTSEDLLRRIQAIRTNGNFLSPSRQVQKILLLSRVTIGADVAITSIMIQRLGKVFPRAEMIIIGGNNLEEVYGGNSRIRVRKVSYSRKGGLLSRLLSWHPVLQIIREETVACPLEKTILIDPDSRLSQLGILPLIARNHYFFFDSRSGSSLNNRMSMPELANAWIDKVIGAKETCYPKVWVPDDYLKTAERYCRTLRGHGTRKIMTINFGVGGNPRKRVGRPLEEKLLLTLLQEPDTVILLDKGFGDEELAYTNALIKAVENNGYRTCHMLFGSKTIPQINRGVIGVQSRIGEMGALIAQSDQFIGYDSAGQHIASALGTPCITIFAGSNNMRFIRRWSPYGPRSCHIVHVDTLTDPSSIDVDNIITRILNLRKIQD